MAKACVFLSWSNKGSASHEMASYFHAKFNALFSAFDVDLVFSDTNMSPGEWRPQLKHKALHSDVCLVFYDKLNLESNNTWPIFEAALAEAPLSRSKINDVFPVLLGGLSEKSLPEPHQGLQAFDGKDKSFLRGIEDSLCKLVGKDQKKFRALYRDIIKPFDEGYDDIIQRAERTSPPPRDGVWTVDHGTSVFDDFEGEYYAINAPLVWERNFEDIALPKHVRRLKNKKLKSAHYIYTFPLGTRPQGVSFDWGEVKKFFGALMANLTVQERNKLRFCVPEKDDLKHLALVTYFVGSKAKKLQAVFYPQFDAFASEAGTMTHFIVLNEGVHGGAVVKNLFDKAKAFAARARSGNGFREVTLRDFCRLQSTRDETTKTNSPVQRKSTTRRAVSLR